MNRNNKTVMARALGILSQLNEEEGERKERCPFCHRGMRLGVMKAHFQLQHSDLYANTTAYIQRGIRLGKVNPGLLVAERVDTEAQHTITDPQSSGHNG